MTQNLFAEFFSGFSSEKYYFINITQMLFGPYESSFQTACKKKVVT